MNIQLRDSKPLQDAIKARHKKNFLPKPQLHPELLNGLLECDRGGFVIRSEILGGERDGEPNRIDVENMSAFLAGSSECEASWTVVGLKQGESFTRIPSELVFLFPDQSKLVVRTQSVNDVTKLTSAIPSDHRVSMSASLEVDKDGDRVTGARFKLTRQVMEKVSPLSGTSEANLKVEAAKLGVDWDKRCSLETMIKRIEAAKQAVTA